MLVDVIQSWSLLHHLNIPFLNVGAEFSRKRADRSQRIMIQPLCDIITFRPILILSVQHEITKCLKVTLPVSWQILRTHLLTL